MNIEKYTYGTDNDDWDEDDFRASGGDKYKLRHEVVDCIMQMPNEKAWEYITYLDSQDGCISDDEYLEWTLAVANDDLGGAVHNLLIKRDYISARWAKGIIDELKTNNYYNGDEEE